MRLLILMLLFVNAYKGFYVVQGSKKLNVKSGIGVPCLCQPGMSFSEISKNIGDDALFCDSERGTTTVAKSQWGMEFSYNPEFDGDLVRTLLFHVRPVKYADVFMENRSAIFLEDRDLFRGVVDGDLDFANGNVSLFDVVEKYGDSDVVFQQGEFFKDIDGLASYKILDVNGNVLAITYQDRGISFIFENNHVDDFVIFMPAQNNGAFFSSMFFVR